MNTATVSRAIRMSPNHSRRNSGGEGGGAGGGGLETVVVSDGPSLVPKVVVAGARRRRHTGGDGSAADDLGGLTSRTGSWRGVNESDEDVAARVAAEARAREEVTPVSTDPLKPWARRKESRVTPPPPVEKVVLDDPEEEAFRRRLAFFFFNPLQKYRARKQFPWKLALQFLKVVLVTVQIMLFGDYRYAHTRYFADNRVALEHLFLRQWDSVREINAYPPAVGAFAVYRKEDFYGFMDYVVGAYDGVENATVNPVFKDGGGVGFCVERFADGRVFPNLTWSIDFDHLDHKKRCIALPEEKLGNFSSKDYLKEVGFEIPWDTMTRMRLNFTLKTLTYTKMGPLLGPECFTFHTRIVFDNSDYDGQMPIKLDVRPRRHVCPQPRSIPSASSAAIRFLDFMVALTCLASFVLCLRALIRGQMLRSEAEKVLKQKYQWTLTVSEKQSFLNGWYVLIIINDVLLMVACVLKELIESRNTLEDLWDACSVCLGVGNLLVWIGMLRYLGFFKTYNVLILTMKGALPSVLRFLLCGGLMYFGFVFCGWIILGPYNIKFRTVLTTSECLFSLINGDDMFATFSLVPADSGRLVWYFSRIYLYLFISLFIYVVLSLFIAIIMDTYELIKEYYEKGFPRSRLATYCEQGKYDPASAVFREGDYGGNTGAAIFRRLFGRGGGGDDESADDGSSVDVSLGDHPASNGSVGANDREPLVT